MPNAVTRIKEKHGQTEMKSVFISAALIELNTAQNIVRTQEALKKKGYTVLYAER